MKKARKVGNSSSNFFLRLSGSTEASQHKVVISPMWHMPEDMSTQQDVGARSGYSRQLRIRLTKAREEQGLSQREVADRIVEILKSHEDDPEARDKIKLTQAAVSSWEKFIRHPGIDNYAAWCRALGYQLHMTVEPASTGRVMVMTPRERVHLNRAINAMSPERYKTLQVALEALLAIELED